MEVARQQDVRAAGRASMHVGPAGLETIQPPDTVLYAVLDDIRNTLGVAWLDPIFRTIASDPLFVIAAWAATRPNITKTFSESAARLRRTSLERVHAALDPPDHLPFVHDRLRPEDADRLIRTVRALHQGLPKVYLVVQAWARLARRQRIPGTGREEVPARRGIPPWQEGVLVPGSAPHETKQLLEDTASRLDVPTIPSSLFALAPAPVYLVEACEDIVARSSTPEWSSAVVALRRCVTTGIDSFPHPMELQWDALAARGLTPERRELLVETLRDAAAVLPVAVLSASFLCAALGGPESPGDL
jgi:halocarboxylic acid dehydrogenase DehI